MSKIVRLFTALLLAAPPAAASAETCTRSMPSSINAPDDLRHHMGWMLQRSATFRQQCRRIDVPRLHVQIRPDVQLLDRPFRARSIIQRSETGRLTAWVAITPLGNPTQWLAHELEHIIEQLDGVDLAAMAARSATGVSARSDDGQYETERAVAAGQRVAQEVRDGQRREP